MIPHGLSRELVGWLLDGDVSIQHQVQRDLLAAPDPSLRARVATEGWGARLLAARGPHGHWGRSYYQPKWTSTHYTLVALRRLELPRGVPEVDRTLNLVFDTCIGHDGGVNPAGSPRASDGCINGMALDFATWFGVPAERLRSAVDFQLGQRMPDGGFNCCLNRGGAVHSSMHTTINVLDGIQGWLDQGYRYRADELAEAGASAREFLLQHHLFRSDRSGDVIHTDFLRLSYPGRWRYDILRALEHFRAADHRDPRLADAISVLESKRRPDGRWNLQARLPGQTFFDMERAGQPSRWNTLRALRVLRWWAAG